MSCTSLKDNRCINPTPMGGTPEKSMPQYLPGSIAINVVDILLAALAIFSFYLQLSRMFRLNTTFGLNKWPILLQYVFATTQVTAMAVWSIRCYADCPKNKISNFLRVFGGSLTVFLIWLGSLFLLFVYLTLPTSSPSLNDREPYVGQGISTDDVREELGERTSLLQNDPPISVQPAIGEPSSSAQSTSQQIPWAHVSNDSRATIFLVICSIWTLGCLNVVLIILTDNTGDWKGLVSTIVEAFILPFALSLPSLILLFVALILQFRNISIETIDKHRSALSPRATLLLTSLFILLGGRLFFASQELMKEPGNIKHALLWTYFGLIWWFGWVIFGLGQMFVFWEIMRINESGSFWGW